VTSADSASALASTNRPSAAIARPRTGAGTTAHSRCARRAASAAATMVSGPASRTDATTSSSRAGLRDRYSAPSSTCLPSITELIVCTYPTVRPPGPPENPGELDHACQPCHDGRDDNQGAPSMTQLRTFTVPESVQGNGSDLSLALEMI